MMIAESFDPRTLANMEVALERACKALPLGSEQHEARRQANSLCCRVRKYCRVRNNGTIAPIRLSQSIRSIRVDVEKGR